MARLISVNVGLPRNITWQGKTVCTGIWKQSVQGRRMVSRLNVAGDGQGDLAGHGGEQRAIMVYQTKAYSHWEAHFGRKDFTFGQFGENFTVQGLADDEVCIGDRYRIGEALFEVTQPRVTCYRVGIRMGEPDMAALLVSHNRPGFYLRVLEEGTVAAGDEITKVAEGEERMTVAAVDRLLYLPGHPRLQLEAALRIPALSPGWKSSFRAILDQNTGVGVGAGNSGLTGLVAPPPAWPGFRQLVVRKIVRESAGVVSLFFQPAEGSPLPTPLPGQFLVLKLHVTPGLPPVLRNYSISSAPGADAWRVSVKLEVNGIASSFVHNQVRVGDILEVSGPRGNFTLITGDEPVVLMSAGIGATPMLSMLHALASSATRREVWWLHGARNGNEHAFAQESRALLKDLAKSRSHITYSQPGPEDCLGSDYDSSGRLDIALLHRLGIPRNADFYLCGPPLFSEAFSDGLRAWHVPPTQVHKEVFGPERSITPGISPAPRLPAHPPEGAEGTGPLVSFTRSGLTVRWTSSFQNLLEMAEACDVPVRWSCRTGVCHTCESALIGGSVDYQPDPLEPPAVGNLLICCSGPRSDVAIDL